MVHIVVGMKEHRRVVVLEPSSWVVEHNMVLDRMEHIVAYKMVDSLVVGVVASSSLVVAGHSIAVDRMEHIVAYKMVDKQVVGQASSSLVAVEGNRKLGILLDKIVVDIVEDMVEEQVLGRLEVGEFVL